MKRVVLFLAVAIFPATAYAQSADAGADDAVTAEIERDWAQAQSNDCDTACRALDSMRRATDRLCAMDPGDRCTTARQKLVDATARVRSACPSCPEAAGRTFADSEKAEPAPPPAANAAAEETVQKKSGGCAGCAVGAAPNDAASAAWLLGGLALLMRRRRALRAGAREGRAP